MRMLASKKRWNAHVDELDDGRAGTGQRGGGARQLVGHGEATTILRLANILCHGGASRPAHATAYLLTVKRRTPSKHKKRGQHQASKRGQHQAHACKQSTPSKRGQTSELTVNSIESTGSWCNACQRAFDAKSEGSTVHQTQCKHSHRPIRQTHTKPKTGAEHERTPDAACDQAHHSELQPSNSRSH